MATKKEIEIKLNSTFDSKGVEEARKQIESLANAGNSSSGNGGNSGNDKAQAAEKAAQTEERRQKKAQEAAAAIEESRRREKLSLQELVVELEKYQVVLEKAIQQENHSDRLKALKNIQDLERRIASLTKAQEREAQAAEKAARAEAQAAQKIDALNKSADRLDKSGKQAARSVKNMGQGALQAAYFFDDLQYGIRGILNNIPGLVMGFGGGAGLAGAISLAVLAGSKLYEWMGNADDKSKELKKDIEEEAEAFKKLKEEVREINKENNNEKILAESLANAKKIADQRKLEADALKHSLNYRKELIALESGIKDDEAEIARLKVEEDFADGKLGTGKEAERRKARLLEGIESDSRARRRGEKEELAALDLQESIMKKVDAARRQREASSALENMVSNSDDIMSLDERRAAEVSLTDKINSLKNDLYESLKALRDKEADSGSLRFRNVSDKDIYDSANQFSLEGAMPNKLVYALLEKYRPSDVDARFSEISNLRNSIENSDISLLDKGFDLGDESSGDSGYSNAYKSYVETIEKLQKEYEDAESSLINAINDEEKATQNLANIKKKNESEEAVDRQRGRTAQAQERKSIREEREKEDYDNEIKGRKRDIENKTDELKNNENDFSAALDNFMVAAGKSATDQQKAIVKAASEAIRDQVRKAASDGSIDSREYEQLGVAFRDALRQQGVTTKSILSGLSGNLKDALLLINIQSGELKDQRTEIEQMKKELEQTKKNVEGIRRRKH